MGGSACEAAGWIAWLDCHAGAVQALSAAAIVGLTAVLVRVTARYARTTDRLADTTSKALDLQLTAVAVAQAQLLSATHMLQVFVEALEPAISSEKDVRRVNLWAPQLIDRFEALAPNGGSLVARKAVQCGVALRRLSDFVQR
ncbi:MAG: hypothetical protein ACREJT_14890, partial [Myxococcota bacterium]